MTLRMDFANKACSKGNNMNQSQDQLDTSSASSLSVFTDPNSPQICGPSPQQAHPSGESSPRASLDEVLKSEKAFIDFVMSLPSKDGSISEHHVSSDSVAAKPKCPASTSLASGSSSSTKVGLDHLDNLCKLMEQLSELRDTNNKLQRRVQYLEDLKTIHDMHKEMSVEVQNTPEESTTRKTQVYELQKSATESFCHEQRDTDVQLSAYRHSSKYSGGRRSRNPTVEKGRRGRSKSVGHEDKSEDPKSKRIFPKWSKVKEAFGWESERKENLRNTHKTNFVSLNMDHPRRCSDEARLHRHSCASHGWSQAYSSTEDINEIIEECISDSWKKSSDNLEKGTSLLQTPITHLKRQKSTPSPGSEKLNTFREAVELQPKSLTIERDTSAEQAFMKFEKDESKRGKSPWGRVKTIIERRRDSIKRRSHRRNQPTCPECYSNARKSSDIENFDIRDYSEDAEALKPRLSGSRHYDAEVETLSGAATRTPSSSPTFHRKSRWTRVKKAFKGKKEETDFSSANSPNVCHEKNFTFDITEEMSREYFEEPREISGTGSEPQMHHPVVLDQPTCDLMLQLQRNLSQDFHRKILEWERMRNTGNTFSSPKWDRKPSEPSKSRKKVERYDKTIKPKLKDLSWLEKELQKIEKEKQRLSKERQKYEERALRLEKLRETVLSVGNTNKKEVLVRTSAGEFRFEGISDAFTKKLYEWETKRGVRPELSTIALLDASCHAGSKMGPLQRVVSRSESSLADVGQPSHTSSNSLPSLKPLESGELNQHSRANSEPDLSTLVAFANGTNSNSTSIMGRTSTGISLEDELNNVEVSKESEEEDHEKERKDSETYYSLLEENVILLEQLKDKEEICRRLEKELELLDEKVEEMSIHHAKETERYREKLWEMHKPGQSPKDVQNCLQVMSQLKMRIESLEQCTEKLRNERVSLEDSFRYHSKQQEHMTLDLLEKMGELQAAGNNTEVPVKKYPSVTSLDSNAVERLQDLSALLIKQTQELEETLSAKTRQICQLKWELLHRDLSTVKLETELHTKTAHHKRHKYAHLRSHSSEEASETQVPMKMNFDRRPTVTEVYSSLQPVNDFQTKQLSNTVKQLNRELLRLSSAPDYIQRSDVSFNTNKKHLEISKGSSDTTGHIVHHHEHITVRRSSADNINLAFVDTASKRNGRHYDSSTDSNDYSSEDDYTLITCPSGKRIKNSERFLISGSEQTSRTIQQRRKKLQKIGRSSSTPNRKKMENSNEDKESHKYHSFRYPEDKHHSKYGDKCNKTLNNANERILREVSSDSKIPFLVRGQSLDETRSIPIRSLSDKQKRDIVLARRERLQKRRSTRKVKSPDLSLKIPRIKPNFLEEMHPEYNQLKTLHLNKNQNENSLVQINSLTTHSIPSGKHKFIKAFSNNNNDIIIHKGAQTLNNTIIDNSPLKENSLLPLHGNEQNTSDNSQVIYEDLNQQNRDKDTKIINISIQKDDQNSYGNRKRKAENGISNTTLSHEPKTNHGMKPTNELERPKTNYTKSPSAPQLDWRKVCAKKTTREGAPHVKMLIEKYNQRIMDSQSSQSPLSSNVNSPTSIRKVSVSTRERLPNKLQHSSFSTPNTPTIVSASTFYNPLIFKPANLDLFPKSPPSSPTSRARTEALQRAKEKFITSPCKIIHPTLNRHSSCPEDQATKPSPNDKKTLDYDQISNASMDSIAMVIRKTGETCQESRLTKKSGDSQKVSETNTEASSLKTSKSLSTSSIFKNVLNPDTFRLPSNFFKLKRSRKKDMPTVSQLCRQSLLIGSNEPTSEVPLALHRSCPSSPELKSRNNGSKQGWLYKNIFRQKQL